MNAATTISYFCKFDKSMQKAQFLAAEGDEPRPLLVGLHTWSYTYTKGADGYIKLCQEKNWNLIFPDFRGPNWNVDGCGSELVVSDLEDAVAYMKKTVKVDPKRVYLVGGSGGGHCSLLMAGRRPDLWSAVSAWCPISDVAAWHQQCLAIGNFKEYSEHIEQSCGGNPATDQAARKEATKRSPLTWLPNATNVTLDISTGIHDGHTGSVPISQAINAYNVLAAPEDRIADADIQFMVDNESVPPHLAATDADQDPALGRVIHLRKQSNNVRLTLFEGGHDLIPYAAVAWLEKQQSGTAPDWSTGKPEDVDSAMGVALTK